MFSADGPGRGVITARKPKGRPAPVPEPQADWQPGVIAGSDALRPLLDGEPFAGAVAASTICGWILLAASMTPSDRHARFQIEAGGLCRVYGRVSLVACR